MSQYNIPECCKKIKVDAEGNAEAVLRGELFTTYVLENYTVNDEATYTSMDQNGTQVISVDKDYGSWIMQLTENRLPNNSSHQI